LAPRRLRVLPKIPFKLISIGCTNLICAVLIELLQIPQNNKGETGLYFGYNENKIKGTLVYRIEGQAQINMQVGKFWKKNKRAGQNRRAGGICF
jgi:hypothetical protein